MEVSTEIVVNQFGLRTSSPRRTDIFHDNFGTIFCTPQRCLINIKYAECVTNLPRHCITGVIIIKIPCIKNSITWKKS